MQRYIISFKIVAPILAAFYRGEMSAKKTVSTMFEAATPETHHETS